MNIYGKASLFDLFGKNIIFRNLDILDKNLPQFEQIRKELSLTGFPRKNSVDYARVILFLIKKINPSFEVILYFGDTELDKTVIRNLKKKNRKKIFGFIFDKSVKEHMVEEGVIYNYNKWEDIAKFINEFKLNNNYFALFDLDKTVIGARARNSEPIDMARFEAILEIIKKVRLDYNKEEIRKICDIINKDLIKLTEDNQDYTAFLTILVYFNIVDVNFLKNMMDSGKYIGDLIKYLKKKKNPEKINPTFKEIYDNYSNKELTVFKTFRYCELKTTISKFDMLKDETDVKKILEKEITITKEIYDAIKILKKKNIKLLCISDKPDETIFPNEKLKEQGFKVPLYLAKAKIVGNEIYEQMKNVN